MTRKLVKRWRRRMDGGTVNIRLYDDGSMRVRTDHPSDDPATEIHMAARVIGALTDSFAALGHEHPTIGPIRWQSDP